MYLEECLVEARVLATPEPIPVVPTIEPILTEVTPTAIQGMIGCKDDQ